LILTRCAINNYGAYNQVYIEPPPRDLGGAALYKSLTVKNLHYLIAQRVDFNYLKNIQNYYLKSYLFFPQDACHSLQYVYFCPLEETINESHNRRSPGLWA
jgi:hypothetical protein